MTNEQIIKEFTRWILAGTPGIWIKQDDSTIWYLEHTTCWTSSNATYIVDDEHAELRKLQVNDPDTKFEWFTGQRWRNCGSVPNWEPGRKYRVKCTEWYEDPNMVGKPVWVRDADTEEWNVDVFLGYTDNEVVSFKCKDTNWIFAKPVKPEECYQGEKDE